jgi:aspartyl aminopeptidase
MLGSGSSVRITISNLRSRVPSTSLFLRNIYMMTTTEMNDASKAAHDFVKFVNASPTPFHAVKNVKQRLASNGFTEIRERQDWSQNCHPGGKYMLTRNGSTITAFVIGKKWKPGNPVAMIGAHTDSPCLRISASFRPPIRNQPC